MVRLAPRAKHHGAQAKRADLDSGSSQAPIFHTPSLGAEVSTNIFTVGLYSGAGGARTHDQRIMRASHLGRRDLTTFYEVCCQTVVFRTGTTEYAAETCRGLKRVVETTADCVRPGEPILAARRNFTREFASQSLSGSGAKIPATDHSADDCHLAPPPGGLANRVMSETSPVAECPGDDCRCVAKQLTRRCSI
jgi:hypothetical protein